MSNEFRFYSSFNKELSSIHEIAYRLGHSFKMFSEFDERFKIICIHLPKENIKVNLSVTNSIDDLADAILKYNLKDIRKHDKLIKPTVDYKRDFGFSLGFNFENRNGDNILSMHINIGGISSFINYTLSELTIKQIEKFNSQWYCVFIKSLIKFLPIQYAVVRPGDMMFLSRVLQKYKYPIGLLTYFSNDLQDFIPRVTELIKYEEVDNGVITYISKEVFENEEGFNFLSDIMNGIGKSNPKYLI